MSTSVFDRLPDDALETIGSWVAATGAENLARCLKVNRRFRSVLGARCSNLVRQQSHQYPNVETLEQLALWEAVGKIGLWEENRIGFDYASVDIARNNPRHRHEDDILDSQERVEQVAKLLKRFPNCFLRIEAHCGTGAPWGIAERFSVARGMSVVRAFLELLREDIEEEDAEEYFEDRDLVIVEERLHMTTWGRRIAEIAETSSDHYGRVARLGKGWVELYICHGDNLEMPTRPDFYEGLMPNTEELETDDDDTVEDGEDVDDDDEDLDQQVVVYRYLNYEMGEDTSMRSQSSASEVVSSVETMGAIEDYVDSDDNN